MLHNLIICCPSGWNLQVPHLTRWLSLMAFHLGRDAKSYNLANIDWFDVSTARILQMRNQCVRKALDVQATRLLMIDPDMWADAYLSFNGAAPTRDGAKPFLASAWQFLDENPGSVVAAPYCGRDGQVHVFGNDDEGHIRRVARDYAASLTGWVRVAAVGSGLMLIDCDVFRKMKPPWFDDVYRNDEKTKLLLSQDAYFCRRCAECQIPIYVNFDSWCRHKQFIDVDAPVRNGKAEDAFQGDERWDGPPDFVVRQERIVTQRDPVSDLPVSPTVLDAASPDKSDAPSAPPDDWRRWVMPEDKPLEVSG